MPIRIRNLHENAYERGQSYQNKGNEMCCFPALKRLRLIVDKNIRDFMILSRSHAGFVMGEESENGF